MTLFYLLKVLVKKLRWGQGVIFCTDVSGNRHLKRKLIKRRITNVTYIFQKNLASFVFQRYCDNLKFMKAKKFKTFEVFITSFRAKTQLRRFNGHFRIASYNCLQNYLHSNHPFTPELVQLETGYFCFSGLHWQGMYRSLIGLRGN